MYAMSLEVVSFSTVLGKHAERCERESHSISDQHAITLRRDKGMLRRHMPCFA